LVDGSGSKESVQERIKHLRRRLDEATSEYDITKLQERLAKVSGGVAVLKVGAATETAMKEIKARVEDALHATRAAVEEGILPGGGVSLLRALPALAQLSLPDEQQYGVNILRRAIEAPLRQIAQNGGFDGAVVAASVREGTGSFGFNVATGVYEDLLLAGVIDPTKVVRVALQNAASVASLMLTTQAVIVQRESTATPGVGAGMGMGM
jgi:chaperonin GroEL